MAGVPNSTILYVRSIADANNTNKLNVFNITINIATEGDGGSSAGAAAGAPLQCRGAELEADALPVPGPSFMLGPSSGG